MKNKQTNGIDIPECIWLRLLLKNFHVPNMGVQLRCELIPNANKQPVLVKVVVCNLFPEIDMKFVIQKNKGGF